jgi:uncharacterized protein YciI
MKHYLLFYELAPDYLARRGEFRRVHLELAWKAAQSGELLLAGALNDAAGGIVDGAALLFRGDSPAVAEAFARNDPYVLNGLIRSWRVREWVTVAGDTAATPIRP